MDKVYSAKVAPAEIVSVPGAMLARVVCASCGGKDEWRVRGLPEPAIVKKHFVRHGWVLKRRATCEVCAARRKEPPMPEVTSKPAPAKLAADSDAAKRNKRLVVLALEDYFDEASSRYRLGHDDESVGKELDLAPGFIALVREEFYGKLAEPDEVGELRQRLISVKVLAEQIEHRLNDLVKRNGWA
jgi:hypothetical protein